MPADDTQTRALPPADFSLGKVEVALSPLERFEEYLRSRGMRNTEQRRLLVDAVFSHHDHFDADALMVRLPSKGAAGYVSRPTVYRTLSEFVDAGLLRKFELNGRSVYEHDYGYPQHDHMYCTQCHELIEFQSDELLRLRDSVAAKHRFSVLGHRLIVIGVCAACRSARRRSRRKQDRV
ncbi:MAG: transcriptional repressor [Planctomycetes bacterium]|nr:transcriptional repressor [Planctomycetota bacterium]